MKKLRATKKRLLFFLPLLIMVIGILFILGSNFANNNFALRKQSFLNFYSSIGPFLLSSFIVGVYLLFMRMNQKERETKKLVLLSLLVITSIQFVTFLLFGANPYEPNIARRFLYLFIPSLYILFGLVLDILLRERKIGKIFVVISVVISSWIFLDKTYRPFISFSAQASLNDFASVIKLSIPNGSVLILDEIPTGIIDSNLLFNKKINLFNQKKYFSNISLDDPERVSAEIKLAQQLRDWDEAYPIYLLTRSDQELNWLCSEFECEPVRENIEMNWVDFSGKDGGMVEKRDPLVLELNLYKLKAL